MVAPNQNWPVLLAEMSPNADPADPNAFAYWTDITARLIGQWGTSRGKQYELDQTAAGEWRGSIQNKDAALDPANSASPFSPNVVPLRMFRLRMQWPPTVNLLTGDQATAGEATPIAPGAIPLSMQVASNYDNNPQIVTSGSAWQGTQVFQAVVPNGSATANAILGVTTQSIAIGGTYAFQMRARCVTSGQSPSVRLALWWISSTGTQLSTTLGSTATLTGGTSATWTQLTVTGTAPTNAVSCVPVLLYNGSLTANGMFQADGLQFEQAAAASAWVQPGTWYPLWSGYMERWPQSWNYKGLYGLISGIGVDGFAALAQPVLLSCLLHEVLGANGTLDFLYKLDEPSGSVTWADYTGQQLVAQEVNSVYGAGTITAGSSITSATAAGTYIGDPGPVVTLTNPGTPGSNSQGAMSYLQTGNVGIGKFPPIGTAWTRMIAFRWSGGTITGGGSGTMWTSVDWINATYSQATLLLNAAGTVTFRATVATVQYTVTTVASNLADDNWHLAFFGLQSDLLTLFLDVDGVQATTTGAGAYSNPFRNDAFGAWTDERAGASNGWIGDLAMAGQWPIDLTTGQMSTIYTGFRSAFSGETSGQRYSRIVRYAGYVGPTAVDAGQTMDMGPATNILGQTALQALQDVVLTENGNHYVARDGTLTFKSRTSRYLTLTNAYVLGENVSGGEWPYTDIKYDDDPTHIYNNISVQRIGGLTISSSDSTSQKRYWSRPLPQNPRQINIQSDLETRDAAKYLLDKYKDPQQRIQALRLDPSSQPNMWGTALDLEIGKRVRVMRRPPSPAPAIQIDCFVDGLKWDFYSTPGAAFLDLLLTPVEASQYWVMGALHTTLHTTVSAGATTLVLDPLPDSASNSIQADLTPGMQLTLEPASVSNAETVTILSITANSPGYSTATITLTAGTVNGHSSGVTVCEPLPAGVTDPTTWDSSSIEDQTTLLAY